MIELETDDIDRLIRRTFVLADISRQKGNHPFGALLCDQNGVIMLEAENTVHVDDDITRHAEQNLMSMAAAKFTPLQRIEMILVTSTEPCAMCSGATFWVGIRAVIFGLPEHELTLMCINSEMPHPPVLIMPCDKILNSNPHHHTTIIGSILAEEARQPHAGFW